VVRTCRFALAILFLVSLLTAWSSATAKAPGSVTITLTPSIESPQFLGTSIFWSATVQNGQKGHTYDYQFAVSLQNQLQVVKDFRPQNYFTWVPYTVEGTYQVIVTVRDITSVPYIVYAPVAVTYTILPWVTEAGGSAVHPTSHPLVALFSGPPCQSGHSLLVRFQRGGTLVSSTTNSVPCSQKSANFYVAGMLPSTRYMMHWEEVGPNFFARGTDLSFTTGPISPDYPPTHFIVNVPPTPHDTQYPVILFQLLPTNQFHWPSATDLAGNVIWYFPAQLQMTRMEAGGNLFGFPDDLTLTEYDLAGHEILETNVTRINEQLVAKGYRTLDDFNIHETRRLPNGNILLLGSSDLVSTQYQGGTQQDPVDILGDLILVLDHNLQLVWAWDTFEHEDLNRKATQNEVCKHGDAGCPKFPDNFSQANDWLHSNSVQLTNDGNLLLSERHQDWVLKVNYRNGQGDGSVLWKMGPYGDFTILNPPKDTCGDPNVFPWFTHQHDAAFQAQGIGGQLGMDVFSVFDDGNLRNQQCGGNQDSRGVVMLVSEPNRTVTLVTEADLGGYSAALGSADVLTASDGIYASYGNGALNPQDQTSQSTEIDLNGKIVYQMQVDSWSYRIYRRRDLYTPTLP
jgi:arylsulfate sulfotransferase